MNKWSYILILIGTINFFNISSMEQDSEKVTNAYDKFVPIAIIKKLNLLFEQYIDTNPLIIFDKILPILESLQTELFDECSSLPNQNSAENLKMQVKEYLNLYVKQLIIKENLINKIIKYLASDFCNKLTVENCSVILKILGKYSDCFNQQSEFFDVTKELKHILKFIKNKSNNSFFLLLLGYSKILDNPDSSTFLLQYALNHNNNFAVMVLLNHPAFKAYDVFSSIVNYETKCDNNNYFNYTQLCLNHPSFNVELSKENFDIIYALIRHSNNNELIKILTNYIKKIFLYYAAFLAWKMN